MTERRIPSIERVLVAWLPARIGGVRVTAELPANHPLPIVAVDRIAGADADYKLDRPVVDIDVYGSDRAQAQGLAEEIRHQVRHELPQQTVVVGDLAVVITRVRTIVAPRSLPHANTGVRRYTASYELYVHTVPAA